MVRSKIQKDLLKMFKNVKKMGVKSLKSTSTLYVVLALTLINLFVFINNQDNESLFLFLVISLLVYLKTTNMISVLLVPLILVNVLIYLRRLLMSGREGFDNKANLKEFISFVETIRGAPSEEDSEGSKFYTDFVKPVISIKEDEHILSLYKKLSKISTTENDYESEYIANVVELFKDHLNETGSKKNTQNPKATKNTQKPEGYENYGKEALVVGNDDEADDDEANDDEADDDEEDDYEADDYEAEADDYEAEEK